MTTFDEREKALENRYFRNEELKFRTLSKLKKFLGMWAAECMHMSEEDSLEYALKIVRLGLNDQTEDTVITKVLEDMQDADLEISEEKIRDKMKELEKKATAQIAKEYGGGN